MTVFDGLEPTGHQINIHVFFSQGHGIHVFLHELEGASTSNFLHEAASNLIY